MEVYVLVKLDRRGWHLALLLAYILYIVKNIFRQLAFSVYHPREPLWDLGFYMIPELISNGLYNDLPAVFLSFVTPFSLVLFPSFYSTPHKHGIYGCRVGYRILVALCIGHTLRFATYSVTSLPGARPHCQPGAELLKPPSGLEILRFTAGVAPNCGDLVFSGHMFQALTMVYAAKDYSWAYFPQWPRFRKAMVAAMVACCVIQIFTILASRSHYSVDIVVACYTSFLLWTVLWDRWPDPTGQPDKAGGEHADDTPMLDMRSESEGMQDSVLSSEDTQEPREERV